jgi:hypothetical protein
MGMDNTDYPKVSMRIWSWRDYKQFQNTFKARQDDDCFQMCEDLKRMLQGYNTNFFFEIAKFKNAPSVSQQENLKGMMNANNIMRDQKR